jgi:predicted Zn finger-like uncharacterized protein
MYTQCPECLSVFSLDARTIAQAHGYVMCSNCSAGFDCIATLTEHLPPEPFQELAINEPAFEPPRLELVVYRPRKMVVPPVVAPIPTLNELSPAQAAPRFARQREPSKPRRWPWVLICIFLLLGLLAQLGWALRDTLIADPTSGPLLRQACATLGCELPLVQEVGALRLLARDVQNHPSVAGALLISATVRNDAPFAQPWPVVVIKLSDGNGQTLAMRRLSPREYLNDSGELQHGLAAGASTALVFEVEDPGRRAVSFELSFE